MTMIASLGFMNISICTTEASTTEEPGAGKLYAGGGAGGASVRAVPTARVVMPEPLSLRQSLDRDFRTAFAGVTLGNGISLRQAQVIDNFGEGVTEDQFRLLPKSEVTDSWEQVPWEELESDNVAHLDPEGYRYYIPAFMLSVLERYEPTSMRVIGTLSSLYPKEDTEGYYMLRYNLLSHADCILTTYLNKRHRMQVAKQEVEKLFQKLPDDCSLEDIQYHLYVIEKIRNGLARAEAEGTVSQEDAESRLGKWVRE